MYQVLFVFPLSLHDVDIALLLLDTDSTKNHHTHWAMIEASLMDKTNYEYNSTKLSLAFDVNTLDHHITLI